MKAKERHPNTSNPAKPTPSSPTVRKTSASTSEPAPVPQPPPTNQTPTDVPAQPEPATAESSGTTDSSTTAKPSVVTRRRKKTATYSKNKAEVAAEIEKYGDFKGKFRSVEAAAEAENRRLEARITPIKFKMHPSPRVHRENTVWDRFSLIVKEEMKSLQTDTLTGKQIFDACQRSDWSGVERAKYTLAGKPTDGWILSVIAACTTSKYRVLARVTS